MGFRDIKLDRTTWPCESTQRVLVATSIESVTISHIRHSAYTMYDSYLLRFEGPEGSLEVSNSKSGYRSSCDPGELLLSPSLRLENVKTLRIMDCFDRHILEKLGSVMPNLISSVATCPCPYCHKPQWVVRRFSFPTSSTLRVCQRGRASCTWRGRGNGWGCRLAVWT